MRSVLIVAASAMLMSAASAAADPHAPAAPRHVVLTGTVDGVSVSQQEPGATPQVSFYLNTGAGDANAERILVGMPQSGFPCSAGERVTLEGDFVPADPPFPPILLAPRLLSCDSGAKP